MKIRAKLFNTGQKFTNAKQLQINKFFVEMACKSEESRWP